MKGKKVKKEIKISGIFFIKMIQIDNLHEFFFFKEQGTSSPSVSYKFQTTKMNHMLLF